MMLGLYQPGDSALHRASAGSKLALLAAAAILIVMTPPSLVVATLLAVGLLWQVSGLGWAAFLTSLRPLLWLLAVVIAFHAVFASWPGGLAIAGKIVALVALASLVSLTTKVSDMLDTLVKVLKPLRRVGVNAEATAFMAVLAIRFAPALFRVAQEVRDAQKSRGLERNVAALAVPLLMRALKESDAVADALEARGWAPE